MALGLLVDCFRRRLWSGDEVLFAVFVGGAAFGFSEYAGEVALVGEATFEGNLDEAFAGAYQELAGSPNAVAG